MSYFWLSNSHLLAQSSGLTGLLFSKQTKLEMSHPQTNLPVVFNHRNSSGVIVVNHRTPKQQRISNEPSDSEESSAENDEYTQGSRTEDEDDDDAVCICCASSRDWDNLLHCDRPGCLNLRHNFCDPSLGAGVIPEGDYFCSDKCAELNEVYKARELESSVASTPQSKVEHERNMEEYAVEGSSVASGFGSLLFVFACNVIVASASNPFFALSVYMFAESMRGMTKTNHKKSIAAVSATLSQQGCPLSQRQLDVLESVLPPGNIRRSLGNLGKTGLITETTTVSVSDEIEAKYVVSFIHPVHAAYNLYTSKSLASYGPIISDGDSADRIPSLDPLYTAFAQARGFDPTDKSNLTIGVRCWRDGSTSKSRCVKSTAIMLTLAAMDPNTRINAGLDAHTLVSLVINEEDLHYTYKTSSSKSGPVEPGEVSKALRTKAGMKVHNETLRLFFKCWRESEDHGLPFHAGEPVNVRIVLVTWSADKMDRNWMLGIPRKPWHCSGCYCFPGRKLTTEEEFEGGKIVLRNDRQDSEWRKNGVKTDWEHQSIHGVTFVDKSPFTRIAANTIFLGKGKATRTPMDKLHNNDGCVIYITEYAAALIPDLIAKSKEVGNEYLLTGLKQMHIMEYGLKSFHFVAYYVWNLAEENVLKNGEVELTSKFSFAVSF